MASRLTRRSELVHVAEAVGGDGKRDEDGEVVEAVDKGGGGKRTEVQTHPAQDE